MTRTTSQSGQANDAHQGSVQGVFFDGKSSRDHQATLGLASDHLTLTVPPLGLVKVWRLSEVQLDPPIPGVRRSFKFGDGSRFESRDDAAISAWERLTGRNKVLSGVRGLESRWSTALVSLVVALAAVGLFIQFGIPAVARQAAKVTPTSVLATFDEETMKLLESGDYIGPSGLSAARQKELQAEFKKVVKWAGGSYPYRLLLRDGEPDGPGFGDGIGPNAFALPNGTIVMTDQLVALAKDDRELMGVLAHETGHVTKRHGLASVYQALGLTLVTTVVTGDLVSSSTFAAAVPAALLKGGYSRAAETESDEVAGKYMLGEYKTTKPLRDILARLEKKDATDSGDSENADQGNSGGSLLDLLSTHPGTPQRIEHLKAMEQAKSKP